MCLYFAEDVFVRKSRSSAATNLLWSAMQLISKVRGALPVTSSTDQIKFCNRKMVALATEDVINIAVSTLSCLILNSSHSHH